MAVSSDFRGNQLPFLGSWLLIKDTDPQFQQPHISGVVRQMAQDAAASEAEVIQRTAASWHSESPEFFSWEAK